ncbi:hypothetical protein pb186bvf_004659 [Paramecium bursaria]
MIKIEYLLVYSLLINYSLSITYTIFIPSKSSIYAVNSGSLNRIISSENYIILINFINQ